MSYEDCNAVGGMTRYNYEADPKRMAFQAARYLAVAKLLEGEGRVLEVGCADGWGARIVRQHVEFLDAVDVDEQAIQFARDNASDRWPIRFMVGDILSAAFHGYDAVYALDLYEHFAPDAGFLRRMRGVAPVAVIGTPSLESQAYASEISKREHVNCPTKAMLREAMREYWKHVFVLGMNDATLHMGHDAMTHYLIGVGAD